jgi:hypothetical protein
MQPKDLLAANSKSATEVDSVRAMFARIARCIGPLGRGVWGLSSQSLFPDAN